MAANWSDDLLPSVSFPDTMQWDGTVAGPLSLVYSDAAFAGAAGNLGVNLDIASTQTDSLKLDASVANTTNAFRLNNISIAAGAGAFSLGDGANTFNLTLGGAVGQTHVWTNDSSNTAVVASDVVIGLGGGGAHNLLLGGAGNWTFNNAIGQGAGTLTIVKNGTGALTLTGASTYTGGLVLNAGALNINNAAAIGNTTTGALTINGGTIDNTSGAAITTTTAKAQNWNGDFTFKGTNALNFNGGTVTLGGAGSSRTVNLSGGALTVGNLAGPGYGLTKTGPGVLAIASGAVSRITGVLNVAGGTIQFAQGTTAAATNDLIVGGLTGSGTIETGNSVSRWLFVQNTADNLFSGVLQNGAGGGALGLNKAGTGTLTLTGVNTYTSQTTIAGGTLEFGSASTPGIVQTLSTVANTGLVFDRGDGAVKSSFNGSGSASLTFGSRVLRTAGATGNFIISGGTNGADNRINLTRAAGFINQGIYFNGDNFAWMDGTNTFVRALAYNGVEGVTSGATTSLASAGHQEFTGDISSQGAATFTTLKDTGNNALTLAAGATVTVNGLLKAGNVAGGATISGGAGLQAPSNGELVIRTDRANDSLTINTPILANGTSSLTTSGAGTLTLGGANTYTGQTTINSAVNLTGSLATGLVNIVGGGSLTLSVGSVVNPSNASNGQFNVGSASGGNAVLNINGGTLNAGKNSNPSFVVGGAGNAGSTGSTNNVSGFVRMTSGTLSTAHELHVGNGSGAVGSNAYAAFTMSGGTVNSGNWLVVGGANGDRAVLNQSGGSITVAANRMTIGAGAASSIGVVNLSGGSLTDNGGIFVGENGTGTVNMSGSGLLDLGAAGTLQFAGAATSVAGTVNLLGGTIAANSVTKGTGTGVYRFNFNGGTLKATATNAAFFASLANTQAYVNSGGAVFDTNGFDVAVAQPLLAPTGSGLNSIALASGGAGYLDTPVVTVSGGSGTGAQAVANVSNGVVTGFTITNPGSGYQPTDVLTVSLFGGGATTPASVGTVALAPNAGGGLTKNGNGTLTLSAANSYTGNVTVNQGTLIANFTNIANPTTSALGDDTVAGRTITVAPGATLKLTANDSFGNQNAVPANLPSLIISGTLNTTRYNQIGALTLNGATLSSSNTTDSGNYQNFQFLGDVTVTGSAPSVISAGGAVNFDANHLGSSTTFTVADVTGNGNADLIVSAPFRDQSGNFGLASGGLVKAGPGRMDLTGASTYTGYTTVSNGTLVLGGLGSINSSSGVTINGAGAKLVLASSAALTPAVTLASGAIDGAGAMSTVYVADSAANVIANGNGVPGAVLTIGSLTFGGAATLSLSANGASAPLAAGALTTGGVAGGITINVSNVAWNNGQTYDLVSYGTLTGALGDFKKGAIGGLGARQNATLGNSGTAITLAITGDLPVWTGSLSGDWTTDTLVAPKNWKLQAAGTATDFLLNDTVLFDDTAAGTTTVNISGASVSPATTTFNNNTKTYTLTAAAGRGIASGSLTKNGNGTLNLGGTHTYTGPTLLNAGVTNLTGSLGDTPVTVASGATLNLQAANAISQNTLTVNGAFSESVDNALGGTAALVLNNGGTLSRPNAHSGGTTLNSGTLNIVKPTGLGTGAFIINGGTIDNTSGGALTLTNNNAQTWGGSGFAFKGTNALNLGTGPITLNGDAATGVFTITNTSALSGASLIVPGPITPGVGGAPGARTLIIEGAGGTVLSGNFSTGTGGLVVTDRAPGTLTLSGAASVITTLNLEGGSGSVVELGAGNLTVANGGGSIVQSTTGGTINALGGGSLVIGSANGDFGTAGGTTLTVNAKIAGTNAVDFYSANGSMGTVVLAAANTHTGAVNIQNVHVVVPAGGAINALNGANSGQLTVGAMASSSVLDLNGGAINATKTASPSVVVGNVSGAVAAFNMTSGDVNSTSEFWVGSAAGAYGAFTMSGGTVNVGSWLPVGRNGSGYLKMSGGTLNVTGQNFTTGSFTGANGGLSSSFGVVNLTGGAVNVTNTGANQGGFLVGESGVGNLNVSGSAALTISGARGLNFATNAGGVGVANLNGGTVVTPLVQNGAGTGVLNFDGGTLKASAASATFMQGLTYAYINKGGAVIDDGGFAITVAQPLLAPTGNGVSRIVLFNGTGYVGAPLVQIGGDGRGATGVANIDANGNLTGITITNPGVDYTTATVSLIGGGGFGDQLDSLDLARNVSGGLTKKGNGVLTLSGASTYTGPTVVESGTLVLTGSISGSSSIATKANAIFNVSGVAGGFSLAGGQSLGGGGFVVGNVAMSAGSKLSPGDGVGALTFGGNLDLTLAVTPAGSGALVFDLSGPAASDRVAFTSGGLAIGNGVLGFDDFAFTAQAGLASGTYTLFDGNTPIAGSLDVANLSGALGGGFTGTLSLGDGGNDLVLTVVPEPGSAALLLAGAGSALGLGRFRRRPAGAKTLCDA